MIPKNIHYCWFGKKPLTKETQEYIESWKKFCPDYKIYEWNELNFDVRENRYCREAYETQKWAFVSDYARLKVLYEYGGIYLDTDIELVKGLDSFTIYDCFFGFEAKDRISTGVIGARKYSNFIKMLLDEYSSRNFIKKSGKLDMTTNVELITQKMYDVYDIKLNNEFQIFGGNNALFPFDFFCAKDLMDGKIKCTENTYAIHHFKASWVPWYGKLRHQVKLLLVQLLGREFVLYLKKYQKKK